MDVTDTADDALDSLLARSAPALAPGAITAATALPSRVRASGRRRRRWGAVGALAGLLTFGGTARSRYQAARALLRTQLEGTPAAVGATEPD